MSKIIGQTLTATIAPTQTLADGSKVPAPVTSVDYSVTPAGAYTIAPATDGLSAVLTAAVVATSVVVTVTAVNSAGTTLTDSKPADDVVAPVPVADALNLTVA